MCHTYISEIEPLNPTESDTDLAGDDPMKEACLETFQKEPYILAMTRNLLVSNITFAKLNNCANLTDTHIWTKLKPVWKLFTETIEREEFLSEAKICSLFTNTLNPLICRFNSMNSKDCESKLIESIFAFWYLYGQAALNVDVLENCWTVPQSLIKMKTNPLNPKIYEADFDLTANKIVEQKQSLCDSHNQLWLALKDSKPKKVEQKSSLGGAGLQQFHSFGRFVNDF
ncbi:hypothetical protein M3Y97_00541000 [Aphelenchoides bicaudatus]|nr:hypothetical protein M3Y97_00541000 [Aphelenchoides bicaudatus]